MARTTITIPFTQEQTTADQTARRILAIDGYHEIDYNGEKVWKKGTGLMTAMHYIKLEFQDNQLAISGWIQVGIGSVGGKERDLSGFTGVIPKQSVRSTMNKILAAIS